MSPVVLDPSYEELPRAMVLPDRSSSLRGATIGVISNGKAGARFFDHLEHMLRRMGRRRRRATDEVELLRRPKASSSTLPRLGGDVRGVGD